ncbi:MAG: hypothetical protein H6819_10965 [Phycisphaerales bacterium]|nr:hypothetical protein [Phycisphaerales bacterium]MCB9855594.1 hypothetical protein [Phycisphaerales bacterium]MCB9864917.1 hypothetical protein [Phycisphaerales bacterium]
MSRRIFRFRLLQRAIRLPAFAGGLVLAFVTTGCSNNGGKTTAGPYVLGEPGGISITITEIGVGPAADGGLVPIRVDEVVYVNGEDTGNTQIRHRTTIWVDNNNNDKVDPGEEAVQESSSPPPAGDTNPLGDGTPVPPAIDPNNVIHVPNPVSGQPLIIKVKVELEYKDRNGQSQDGGFIDTVERKVPN